MKTRLLKCVIWLLLLASALHADPALDERVREIASELRCVVCQNLSVADSPSEMAIQMRGIVRQQLEQGKSAEEIKAYFVTKYGEWVLLAPTREGFNLIVWVLPFVVLVASLLCAGWVLYRWSRKPAATSEPKADQALLERVRDELTRGVAPAGDADDPVWHARNRVYRDIQELDFDYQAGKISRADHDALRARYENQAASLMARERPRQEPASSKGAGDRGPSAARVPLKKRGWVLSIAGAVLVAGGIAIGLLLGQSLKPRASSDDSITGGFLTGTAPSVDELVSRGRLAFENKDLNGAIESFKEALRADPGNAEANAYMGLILAQAGHSDAALLAFDRALSRAPRLPVALWAKGMVLYRDKRDVAGARQTLRTLVEILPPGEDRKAIEDTIAQLDGDRGTPESESAAHSGPALAGTIVIDPPLAANVDPGAVLFIIARRPGTTRGPPLAVKRVARPSFPLAFELGAQDTMIPGSSFDGALDLTVRLDRDGNPMTREPGSLTGVYDRNPVTVGTRDITITIDQVVGE